MYSAYVILLCGVSMMRVLTCIHVERASRRVGLPLGTGVCFARHHSGWRPSEHFRFANRAAAAAASASCERSSLECAAARASAASQLGAVRSALRARRPQARRAHGGGARSRPLVRARRRRRPRRIDVVGESNHNH